MRGDTRISAFVAILRRWIRACVCLSAIALSACEPTPVLNSVSENESIDVLAALAEAGIPATRTKLESGRELRFSISVPEGQTSSALAFLAGRDIAEDRTEILRRLLERKTFMPMSPAEERSRVHFLRSIELERSILGLGGIRSVRVSFLDDSAQENSRPTIVARYDDERWQESELMAALQKIIGDELVSANGARVLLRPEPALPTTVPRPLVSLPFPFSFQVPAAELRLVRTQLYAIIVGAIMSSLIVGMYIGMVVAARRVQLRRSPEPRTRKPTSGAISVETPVDGGQV